MIIADTFRLDGRLALVTGSVARPMQAHDRRWPDVAKRDMSMPISATHDMRGLSPTAKPRALPSR